MLSASGNPGMNALGAIFQQLARVALDAPAAAAHVQAADAIAV